MCKFEIQKMVSFTHPNIQAKTLFAGLNQVLNPHTGPHINPHLGQASPTVRVCGLRPVKAFPIIFC